jgi:hypothetical protein
LSVEELLHFMIYGGNLGLQKFVWGIKGHCKQNEKVIYRMRENIPKSSI